MRQLSDKLTDKFEIGAVWSFNAYDRTGQSGYLKYNDGEIIVEIPTTPYTHEMKEYEKVYGTTQDGRVISLFNVFEHRKNTKKGLTLKAEYMVIDSTPINSIEELYLENVDFSFNYLPLFMNQNIWENKRPERAFKKKEIRGKEYNLLENNAHLKERYFSLESQKITPYDGLIIKLRTHPYFSINYEHKKGVLEIKKDIEKLQHLYTLLCGVPLKISYLLYKSRSVDLGGGLMPIYGHFYFRQSKVERTYNNIEATYKYSSIKDKLNDIINNYLSKYEKLRPIIQNISVNLRFKNLAETQYHDAITCIEVYYREFYGENSHLTPEEESLQDEMLELVNESGFNSGERRNLRSKVENMYKITLHKRVRGVLRDLPLELKRKLNVEEVDFLDNTQINIFSEKCAHTRNYHAHGSTDEKKDIFRGISLVKVARLLTLVGEYCLLKEIGIPEAIIVDGILSKKKYRLLFK